jgi:hypothetical protein
MEIIRFPKCRYLPEPHGVKSQKIFVIVTAVNTSQKTAFLGPTYYSSLGRLIKKSSTKQQPINNYSTVTDGHNCGGAVAIGSLPRPLRGISSLRARKIHSPITLKMEAICSLKRRILLEPHSEISQKIFVID